MLDCECQGLLRVAVHAEPPGCAEVMSQAVMCVQNVGVLHALQLKGSGCSLLAY
jgi:hypothetical protein